ncbi:hypothetical protein CISG_05760 [Coccidioides immitis RMSCC 3703]|uniref:DUF202 domain-containing protein n=1 Tax=Coccidioides immitis RMSCC 3703 TaxID=454286 RepID=A0A0J8TS95_COCIT|nr:hypothetical protein CISG_05760 [Coccidioides immitis RMSCC 3703]
MEEPAASHAAKDLRHPEPAVIASSSLRARSRVSSPERPSTTATTTTTTGTLTPDLQDAHELSELHEISTHTRRDSSPSTISSGSIRIVKRPSTRSSQLTRSSREPTGRFKHIIKFWRRNVVLSVSQNQNRIITGVLPFIFPLCSFFSLLGPILIYGSCECRAALERTYLAHMRTSVAFSLLGVLIAQLFRLQHSHIHHPTFGFYTVGVPLACTCQGFAILMALFGAHRFLRQQNALSRGKIHAGGWEVMMAAIFATAIIITLLILVVVISVKRDSV